MNKPSVASSDPVERFWDRYIELLVKQGVKESARRWYVMRQSVISRLFRIKNWLSILLLILPTIWRKWAIQAD